MAHAVTDNDTPHPAVQVYGAAQAASNHAAGNPIVKAPSERYSSKRYEGRHAKTGKPVMRDGSPVTLSSEREHALTGAMFRALVLRSGVPGIRPLDDHERMLLRELQADHLFVGEHGGMYYGHGVKVAVQSVKLAQREFSISGKSSAWMPLRNSNRMSARGGSTWIGSSS